uniref:NADH dehydrogenase subunit 2 n=1 Tax=Thrips major TaxID=670476 RepID=UPI0030E13A27
MKNEFFIQKYIFFLSLISSILICFSSNSFLMMWMSMEINLFSVIPMISMNQKFFSEKSTMLYFLIQGISSSLTLLAISMNLEDMKSMKLLILFLSIFMKLGMFPFHFWMISTIEGMTWEMAFILMTIQKMIPMIILMQIIQKKMMIMFCLLNSMIAALSGITMFSMRKIMGFSSINHLSLMLIGLSISHSTFMTYFMIYSLMTYSATKMMEKMNVNFIFQTLSNIKFNKTNNLILMITFLSMAGIPPLLGFMPKVMIISIMMKSEMFLTTLTILVLNTLSTFFYMRMCINNIIMNMNCYKMMKFKKTMEFPLYMMFTPFLMMLN